MPSENEDRQTVNATSQTVSRVEMAVVYKENAEQPPPDPDFIKGIRNDINDRLRELVNSDDIQSITINFYAEDN